MRLIVQVVDLFSRRFQRLPDTLQSTVLGVKEVVNCSLKAGPVFGRPDPVRDAEKFGSGGVGPERMHRRAHPCRVERGRQGDVISSGSEHLGRMGGDGDLVGERSGSGKAMASAMPVVDLLETGVAEELRGEVIGSALGNDAAAELGRDGDRGRHGSLRGRGSEGPVGGGPVGRASGKSGFWSGRESLVEAAR